MPTLPSSDSLELTQILGVDCEMVGVGPYGVDSALARVTIVNSFGNIILDKFVLPKEKVTDFRTEFSGVTPDILRSKGENFDDVQKEVAEFIKDRVVVGHGLQNDLRALLLTHPFHLVRDTARYGPLQRKRGRPHSLKFLMKRLFGVEIQTGAHDSGEDARSALLVYNHVKEKWESTVRKHTRGKKLKRVSTN